MSIHIVLDNYATHKTPAVKRWFLRHPEYHLHFTPTSSSWLNQVERFFAEITEKRIRRGVFRSVPALEQAITDYLAASQRRSKAVRVGRRRRFDPRSHQESLRIDFRLRTLGAGYGTCRVATGAEHWPCLPARRNP